MNQLIEWLGGERLSFLDDPRYFRSVLVATHVWKEIGWGTIIILAALAGVSPELYESAIIDGANKLQQTIRITLPSVALAMVVMANFTAKKLEQEGLW